MYKQGEIKTTKMWTSFLLNCFMTINRLFSIRKVLHFIIENTYLTVLNLRSEPYLTKLVHRIDDYITQKAVRK